MKCAIHQAQAPANAIPQLGAETELPDLGVVKSSDQSIGIFGEGFPRFLVELSVAGYKSVKFFGFRAKNSKECRSFGNRGYSLDCGLCNQMDVPRVAEVFAHESFHAKEDMLLRKVESSGNASLKLKGKRIERTAAQIVHLCAHP